MHLRVEAVKKREKNSMKISLLKYNFDTIYVLCLEISMGMLEDILKPVMEFMVGLAVIAQQR